MDARVRALVDHGLAGGVDEDEGHGRSARDIGYPGGLTCRRYQERRACYFAVSIPSVPSFPSEVRPRKLCEGKPVMGIEEPLLDGEIRIGEHPGRARLAELSGYLGVDGLALLKSYR